MFFLNELNKIPLALIKDKEFLEKNLAKVYQTIPKNFDNLLTEVFNLQIPSNKLISYGDTITIKNNNFIKPDTIFNLLKKLMPWRKGPFSIFDINLDCEWRSDFKFKRVLNCLEQTNLSFKDKNILDIGTGNGYFLYRFLEQQANFVLGIDPSWHYFSQYLFLQHLFKENKCSFLALTHEELSFKDFDILLAMGVLYHRKDPLSFLEKIKENLKKGGILILETLIVEGNENTVFMPEDRYLGMKNVYFIPSIPALKIWLKRLKFEVLYASSAVETTSEEQRKTEWLESYSLAELKKPEEKALRAIIIAQKN